MRTKIQLHSDGMVSLYYYDVLFGDMTTRKFIVPGGNDDNYKYVREYMCGHTIQVCKRLAPTGTAISSTRNNLLDTIRREYRAMRRDEKRNGF